MAIRVPKAVAKVAASTPIRNVVGGAAGLAAVGVGTSFLVGAIPGTENVPEALGGLVAGTAQGLGMLTSNLPLVAAAGVALLLLLRS
jgi:hypothetical protein